MEQECICTVLMIAYNHAPFIRLAIESVLEQRTDYRFKVHIFDDASTDGTSEIVREYAARYPSLIIPFIAEKNQGAQDNILAAYRSVNTKYCAMLECDDYWCDPEKLQLQIDALERNPDCSFCAHNTIYQNLNDVYREKEDQALMVYNRNVRDTGKYGPEDFIPLYGAGWVHHSDSRVIRMERVDLDGLSDPEDFLYDNAQFFYLLQRGRLYFIQRVMSVYVMNMSGTFTSLQVQEKIRGHMSRMLHINETTGRQFERLIFRHLESFTRYWLNLDEIHTGVMPNYPAYIALTSRYLKMLRYDILPHHRLKRQARKKIKQLRGRVEGG